MLSPALSPLTGPQLGTHSANALTTSAPALALRKPEPEGRGAFKFKVLPTLSDPSPLAGGRETASALIMQDFTNLKLKLRLVHKLRLFTLRQCLQCIQ